MGHVNNAIYLDWIEESIASAGDPDATTAVPRRITIEYAASAEPGDALTATTWREDDAWWVRLTRVGDGAVLARACFSA